jgi:hypothetical protein
MRKRAHLKVFIFSFALLSAVCLLLSTFNVAYAAASPKIQLCMVIDGSGTMTDSDWTIIVNAVAKIVNQIIPHDGRVEFALVQFGNDSNTLARTELSPTIIDNTTYSSVSSHIQQIPKMGGSTSMADGIYLAWKELKTSSNYKNAAKHIINLATDGLPNVRNRNATRDLDGDGRETAYDDVIAVVNNSIAQGLTEIDMEQIGVSDANLWFKANVVYPQPGTMAPPFNNTGWVRQVASIEEFANTLPESLQAILVFPEEIYVPQSGNALIAGVATIGTTTIVSAIASAVTNPEGFPFPEFAKKLSDLVPAGTKKWFHQFLKSKRKLHLSSNQTNPLKITNYEIVTYIIAFIVLTLAFAYVKAPTLTEILTVIPTILLTSIVIEFTKNYVLAVVARYKGLWTEHRLWYFGTTLFIISSLAFRVPFSEPGRLVSKEGTATKKIRGLLAMGKVLITLALAGVFTLVFLGGFTLIGNIGIVMCLTSALVESIPIPPMNGKEIYDWSKHVTAGLLMLTLAMYLLMIVAL